MASWPYLLLGFVIAERIVELAWSERNRRALLKRRGREIGAGHYPLFLVLHAAWLGAMLLFVEPGIAVPWRLLGVFVLLQLLRVWTIASLGPFWTTRIITVDDLPLRKRGPYRLLRHPNYLIVAIEVPLLPHLLGLPVVAIVFGVLNLMLLAYRIHIEGPALAERRSIATDQPTMAWPDPAAAPTRSRKPSLPSQARR